MRIPHLSFNLRPRNQCGNRVNHQHVHRVAADKRVDNVQCILTAIRLRNQQIVNIDSDFFSIRRINSVFGVNNCRNTAGPLGIGNDMKAESGFAGRFRSEYFNNSASGQAAGAERNIKRQGAGADGRHIRMHRVVAKTHNGTLAEFFFDLADSYFQILIF